MPGIAGAEHGGPALLEPRGDVGEHLQMDGGVAHDAALADLLATGFELRLDEHEAAVVGAGGF